MSETTKGLKKDLKKLKQRLIFWLWKKLTGLKKMKDPVQVLWDLIDEENHGAISGEYEPNCVMIEAWEIAIKRIGKECYNAGEKS